MHKPVRGHTLRQRTVGSAIYIGGARGAAWLFSASNQSLTSDTKGRCEAMQSQ